MKEMSDRIIIHIDTIELASMGGKLTTYEVRLDGKRIGRFDDDKWAELFARAVNETL